MVSLSIRSARASGWRRKRAIRSASPAMIPACGPPSNLSPLAVTTFAPARSAPAMSGSSGRSRSGRQQPRADVDHQRNTETGQLTDRHRRGEPRHLEVRRMHLQHAAGLLTNRCDVIGARRPVRRSDLAQRRARACNEVRQPESVADLHELTATPHHLAARGQHRHREQQCRGAVIDNHDIARIGKRARSAARAPRPREARRPSPRSYSTSTYPAATSSASRAAVRERGAPQVRVEHRPGRVDDRGQARRPRRADDRARARRADQAATVPLRTRSCDARTTSRTRARPSRRCGSDEPCVRKTSVGLRDGAARVGVHARDLTCKPPTTASAVAEADGNRTRLTGILGHTDFEDQEAHQVPRRLHRQA